MPPRGSRSTLLIALFALAVCRSGAAAADASSVADTSLTFVSADSAWTLDARRLAFTTPVKACAWDSARATAFVQTGTDVPEHAANSVVSDARYGTPCLIAYNLEQRRTMWWRHESLPPWNMLRNRLALWARHGCDLVDPATGERDDSWPSGAWPHLIDGARVAVGRSELTCIDEASGRTRWNNRIETPGETQGSAAYGESLFVYGDAIKAVDLRTGYGWEKPVHEHHGVAGGVAAGLAGVTFGWLANAYSIPGVYGYHIAQMHALPFVDERHVYFADDSLIVCLDRRSGTTRWRRPLAADSTFQLLSRIHGFSM
jgi:hypothetical protein